MVNCSMIKKLRLSGLIKINIKGMKKLFNSGSIIIIGGLLFIFFIFILMSDFIRRDVSMVSDNYYQQEMDYNAHQLASRNSRGLDSLIRYAFVNEYLELSILPGINANLVGGYVQFYCPADNTKDMLYSIEPHAESLYKFRRPLHTMNYILKIQLQDKEKTYFKEIKI